MKKNIILYSAILLGLFLLAGCADRPENVVKVNRLPKLFPNYSGVTIPAEIAPLNFNYSGDCQAVDVVVRGSKGGIIHTNGDYADFDVDEWHELTLHNKGGKLVFMVTVEKDGKWKQYKDFSVIVSTDALGDWGLTYRLIPPGYEVFGKMGLYQRDLSNFDQTSIIENTAVPGACFNCHVSNRTNPNQFTFHIRGGHGATLIQQYGKFQLLKAKNDSLHGSMVYPYWHPNGKFIAYSTNQTHQSFYAVRSRRIEVFDQSSDILIYQPDTHQIILNPVIMTKDHYENYPVFSPDGRTLYFVSSQAWDIPAHYKDIKYNLCKVGFNPMTGKTTGKVDTIFNARAMNKSANHPRPSYDGKFLLFTMSDYGCFPIWHKEADQWLLDLRTGKARPLTEINSSNSDSYHNWSANSHWIVFTSRRGNGYYTTLYLAHVNADGTMGTPFLLPQRNPWKYYDETVNSFNTPDFTSRPVKINVRKVANGIVSDDRIPTRIHK
jgi:hypothetical protein